jgi:hypothetical protein
MMRTSYAEHDVMKDIAVSAHSYNIYTRTRKQKKLEWEEEFEQEFTNETRGGKKYNRGIHVQSWS